jgi:uncharacterized HAD superfamily protein
MSLRSKLIVAVDMDEVLCHFVPKLIDFHNETYKTEIKFEGFHNYAFHKVWGGTPEETTQKVNLFFESPHFKSLPRVKNSFETLLKLKDRCTFVIVTSRQTALKEITLRYVEEHFPDIFDDIMLGNHYGETGTKLSKPEMCQKVGATILIDDSLLYAQDCSKNGIKTILFGNYPWNQSKHDLHELIVRVSGWEDVESEIRKHL